MKKLILLSYAFLLGALSVVSASPLPLLVPFFWNKPTSMVLGLSDADVSAITAYAAANQMPMIASLVNGMDIANDVMVLPNVKNKIPMPKLKVGDGARPYSGKQEFRLGSLKYTDRFLEVKVGKRELQIDPEDYRLTYLAWATSPGSGSGKKEIPFAQFMWEQVLKAYTAELNNETSYKGFDGTVTAAYNAGTVYNPGNRMKFTTATNNPNNVIDWWECVTLTTAGQSPDTTPAKWLKVTARAIAPGLESYILTGIAGTELAPVTTGAITNATGSAIAGHKKMFRSLTPAQKNAKVLTSCSYTDWELLLDDLGEKYKNIKDDASAKGFLVLPETNGNGLVKPATWLNNSRRLITGPAFGNEARHQNLYVGTDLLTDKDLITVKDSELWVLNAGVKNAIGFNVQDMEALRVSDQA